MRYCVTQDGHFNCKLVTFKADFGSQSMLQLDEIHRGENICLINAVSVIAMPSRFTILLRISCGRCFHYLPPPEDLISGEQLPDRLPLFFDDEAASQ